MLIISGLSTTVGGIIPDVFYQVFLSSALIVINLILCFLLCFAGVGQAVTPAECAPCHDSQRLSNCFPEKLSNLFLKLQILSKSFHRLKSMKCMISPIRHLIRGGIFLLHSPHQYRVCIVLSNDVSGLGRC